MANGARYARGDLAWGMCARSGQRLLLKEMVEDPLTGLLVAPDWAEPPLMRPPTDIIDGVALDRPAPDLDRFDAVVVIGQIVDLSTGDPMRPLVAKMQLSGGTAVVTA